MGWYTNPERLPDELLEMSAEERDHLDFTEAEKFVAPDTLERAIWRGLLSTNKLPGECLMRLPRIKATLANKSM